MDDFDSYLNINKWIQFNESDPVRVEGTFAYTGTYSLDATVGANMAQGILKRFVKHSHFSGMLAIFNILGAETGPIGVLRYLEGIHDNTVTSSYMKVMKFDHEYSAMLSILAWLLACDAEFLFISSESSFGVYKQKDVRLTIIWKSSEIDTKAIEGLTNNYFSPIWK